ncbi:MAG TPA: HAMP domain-containing sensor histidine kinase [Bryobacteraceae bacterium]|nr:HAMP domain-containing sensor histidine kinase [Bryobacteraceae bacterium]
MTPPDKWLKPPGTLLVILFLLTLVSVSALAWFGWKLLDQERIVETQRAQERLEQTADQISATLRGALAETGERLSAWVVAPPADGEPREGLLLLLKENNLAATPSNRLLYYPLPSPDPEARPAVFAEGEALEFLQAKPAGAAEWYQHLAGSDVAAVRAGALLRLGRVLRNTGRIAESRAAYAKLADVAGARVAGVPAGLVARHAQCELSGSRSCAEALRHDLLAARWRLTRGQFEFYWSEASRLAGRADQPPAEAIALAEAAAMVWEGRKNDPGVRGQQTVWINDQPFFFIWRGTLDWRAVLITKPDAILKQIASGDEVACAAVDAEGRILAGHKSGKGAAVRTSAESQVPWTLYVTRAHPMDEAGMLSRRRFLMLGMALMVLFLLGCTYFIARAIRREAEVARMQSDFVSAVSHEFRSPLTSLRQLSEILAFGRVPSEERRQVYYETMMGETARLQRLVEALLNFGRMEAGARLYRFEELDTASLVQKVVAEFEPQISGLGRHIEMKGEPAPCTIEGDPEAISVALRNLVDNALKYSPGHPTVWVEWGVEKEFVAIRVRDQGPGVAESEKKAIFRKFVRGSAAAAANVKGSGVGLAMVRDIVVAHRGGVTVASAPGQGSTFTMWLPAAGRA